MDPEHPLRNASANYHDHGWDRYEAFYEHCTEADPLVHLEATTHYLYQKTARRVLSHLTPVPQMLFMLRDPAERLYSSYRYTKHNKGRLHRDFSFADLVARIETGADLRDVCTHTGSAYVLERDRQHGQYIDYLVRWFNTLGRERVHVLLLGDMKREAKGFMKRVARRLDISPSFYDTYAFAQRNRTYAVKSSFLHRQAHRIARVLPTGRVKKGLKKAYMAFQRDGGKEKRDAADRAALARLRRYYRPYNRRLAEHLDRNLAAWNDGTLQNSSDGDG